MIPTYEPGPYLLETIDSVLQQDMGAERMQIMVVDDASPRADVASLLAAARSAGRVNLIRNPDNVGLAGNWNECIRHARGQLVHILHQDDLVLPGFYQRLGDELTQNPAAGMAFSGCAFIDEVGSITDYARPERRTPGLINHWLNHISRRYSVHCPAALVRRSTYERLGGYRLDLRYALDWEMWVRIAANTPVWYDPMILAKYRSHAANETARLNESHQTFSDELQAISIFAEHLPSNQREQLMSRTYRRFADSRLRRAKKLLRNHRTADAQYHLSAVRMAVEHIPSKLLRKFYALRIAMIQQRMPAVSAR